MSIPGRFEGSLGLREATSAGDGSAHDRYAVGVHHVCFYAATRDIVDERWRWLRDRADSPWYPTARLFRQPQPMAWEPVIAEVREQLQLLVPSRTEKP